MSSDALNTKNMNRFLAQVSSAYPHDRILMILDGAGSHKSAELIVPDKTELERQRLMELCQKSGDYRSERALTVLHCADGRRPRQIADMLKRSSQAVCQWLHAYERDAFPACRKNIPRDAPVSGKPNRSPHLAKYLSRSPRDFDWGEDVWHQ